MPRSAALQANIDAGMKAEAEKAKAEKASGDDEDGKPRYFNNCVKLFCKWHGGRAAHNRLVNIQLFLVRSDHPGGLAPAAVFGRAV
jgi:hypothetical protein